jgi:hypothetical protein
MKNPTTKRTCKGVDEQNLNVVAQENVAMTNKGKAAFRLPTVRLLALTVVLLLAFATCDKDPDPCNCNPTAHLGIDETCDCGGSDCKCTEQTATTFDGTTKVRKVAGVSVDDFNTAVEQFNRLNWSTLNSNEKTLLNNTITEIRVTKAGTGIVLNGKVLWVGCDVDADTFIDYLFDEIICTSQDKI